MEKFPVTIFIGAGLLGWIAGHMSVTDAVSREWVNNNAAFLHWVAPACGALLIVVLGKWLGNRTGARRAAIVDLMDDINDKPRS
jgi:hypothetical protein